MLAPPDYQQGDGFRIIYVHAPECVAVPHGVYEHGGGRRGRSHLAHQGRPRGGRQLRADRRLLHRGRAGDRVALGAADVGHILGVGPAAHFGAVLLFLYLGYMGLRCGIEDTQRADRASAVLAVVGVVNVPIIHYSVTWWNSLHQAPSVMRLGKPTMPASMLVPLLVMFLGFTLLFLALLLVRLRAEILSRERSSSWIREALGA